MDVIERARRYLAGIPPAVSGSGGDATTYKAAVALTKGFGLAVEEAFPLLEGWNTHCVPPWSPSELRTKLNSAARSIRQTGYLLKDAAPSVPAPILDKAAQRRKWPAFTPPTDDDLHRIATLRGVSIQAARTAADRGCLCRCHAKGHECFAIRWKHFAQVRRMDGKPFERPGSKAVKTLNLTGSEGAFLTPFDLCGLNTPAIITEGAVSVLEALEALIRGNRPSGSVALLAAACAGSRFTGDDLRRLQGRPVRIIPDADDAGQRACARWADDLRAVSCLVDAVRLPSGCKDLGDALRVVPSSDPYWTQLITF